MSMANIFIKYIVRPVLRVSSRYFPEVSAKLAQQIYTKPEKIRPLSAKEQSLFAKARQEKMDFRGEVLPIWHWGEENKPTVLLSHGWGVGPAIFMHTITRLLEQGFHVVTYLHPAHTNTGVHRTTAMTLVHAYVAVMQSLGKVYATLGHSLGAGVAISAARTGVVPERLVLISPVSDLVENTDNFGKMLGFSAAVIQAMRDRVWQQYLQDCASIADSWDDLFKVIVQQPALFVHDKSDPILNPQHSQNLAQDWPNSRLLITDGLGHFRTVRDSAVNNEVISFLRQDMHINQEDVA